MANLPVAASTKHEPAILVASEPANAAVESVQVIEKSIAETVPESMGSWLWERASSIALGAGACLIAGAAAYAASRPAPASPPLDAKVCPKANNP